MDTKSSLQASKMMTNYSAISNLPKQVINQIKYEGRLLTKQLCFKGEIYCNAPKRCEEFWKEMRRSDFTSGAQLTYKLVDNLFDKFRENFIQLLKVQNSQDVFDLFDQDNDGFLNEDEQILIFSVIKEKMLQVANSLLKIQEYIQFKQLMKEVRTLENNINNYQNELRDKLHKREVQIYGEIGQEKLDDFYDKFYNQFQQLEEYKNDRRQQLNQVQNEEFSKLEDKLSKDTELLKVKPKKKLKDLQTQEKLVSLDERVEEALDFRRELKDFERNEQIRVQNVQQQRLDGRRDDLLRKHRQEHEQLELKLLQHEHKLVIEMKKNFDVSLKQINLHSNEIERIQGLAAKQAIKMGLHEGELKRSKNRSKLQNGIIMDTKAIKNVQDQDQIQEEDEDENTNRKKKQFTNKKMISATSTSKMVGREITGGTNSEIGSQYGTNQNFYPQGSAKIQHNMNYIKKVIKSNNYTSFYIRKKFGADLPVNFKDDHHNKIGDNHQRIEQFLKAKKKSPLDILPSLTDFYDKDLNLKTVGVSLKTEEEIQKEKMKKRAFINEKLQSGETQSQTDNKLGK